MKNSVERTNYFPGQMLGIADYEREQHYFLHRLRSHNRFAHGWGVLGGLEVSIDDDSVVVKPGVAIDCEGNELHVHEEFRTPIPISTSPFFVGVKYVEVPSAPTPSSNGVVYGTVVESALIEVVAVNAAVGHAKIGPGTPGCGKRHALVLARARQHNGRWQLRRAKCGA